MDHRKRESILNFNVIQTQKNIYTFILYHKLFRFKYAKRIYIKFTLDISIQCDVTTRWKRMKLFAWNCFYVVHERKTILNQS